MSKKSFHYNHHPMLEPHTTFLRVIREAFNEPGPFTVELSDEMLILTTKSGVSLRAFVREIFYEDDEDEDDT